MSWTPGVRPAEVFSARVLDANGPHLPFFALRTADQLIFAPRRSFGKVGHFRRSADNANVISILFYSFLYS